MKKFLYFVSICVFLISGCSKVGKQNENLKLLSFAPISNQQTQLRSHILKDKKEDSPLEYNLVKEKEQTAEAIIKNIDRLSFIDIVLRFDTHNRTVVYNEGNGEYTCSTTTILEDDVWITKILIPMNLDFDEAYHSSVTIQSISFLDLNSKRVDADLNTNDIKTLNFGFIGNHTYESNGLIYNIVSDKAYVSSYTDDLAENLLIPERVKTVTASTNEYPVVGIERYAFKDCLLLKNLVFENSDIISLIDEGAFYGCSNLETIANFPCVKNIPSYLFCNCQKLKSPIMFFSGTIGEKAFYNNYLFGTSLILDNYVNEVGAGAFLNCNSLEIISIDNTIKLVPNTISSTSLKELTCSIEVVKEYVFVGDISNIEVTLNSSGDYLGYRGDEITKLSLLEGCKFTGYLPLNIKELSLYSLDQFPILINSTISLDVLMVQNGCQLDDLYNITLNKLYILSDGCTRKKVTKTALKITTIELISGSTYISESLFQSFVGSLEKVILPNTLKEIGALAFAYCSTLSSINIPDSVTTIGDAAFMECVCLNSIIMDGNSLTTIDKNSFYNCKSLKSITIPDSVITIGDSAFADCELLETINIPDSVTTIGDRAFVDCSSLKCITIPDSVTTIGDSAFSGCASLESIKLSSNLTYISDSLFEGCSSLKSVLIPDSVEYIAGEAFYGCSSLKSITIPDSVTNIYYRETFKNCTSLVSVLIQSDSESCLDAAFGIANESGCSPYLKVYYPLNRDGSGCRNLIYYKGNVSVGNYNDEIQYLLRDDEIIVTGHLSPVKELNIPSYIENHKVVSICDYAFYNYNYICKFTLANIPDSVSFIGDYAFCNCDLLETINIPRLVTKIGLFTFGYCKKLSFISIPDSITTISDHAFYECYKLTSFHTPSSLKTIGSYAFYHCQFMSFNIPDSVTTIGDNAFEHCDEFKTIFIPISVKTIGRLAFMGCNSNLIIYCEATSKPVGWDESWTILGNYSYATVVWGYSTE